MFKSLSGCNKTTQSLLCFQKKKKKKKAFQITGAAARSLNSEATGSRYSFRLRCESDPLHSCAVCSGLLCSPVRWEQVPHLVSGEWGGGVGVGGLSADRVAEWFAQQPFACVCLELRSSLEHVTKFLSLSHNWSLLPASLAMRP